MLRNKDNIFYGIFYFYEIVIIKNNGSESYVRNYNPRFRFRTAILNANITLSFNICKL